MKYLLIEICEREIHTPKWFEDYQSAHSEMCRRVSQVSEIDPAALEEAFLSEEWYREDTFIGGFSACTECCGNNFDWKIFEYKEDSLCAN